MTIPGAEAIFDKTELNAQNKSETLETPTDGGDNDSSLPPFLLTIMKMLMGMLNPSDSAPESPETANATALPEDADHTKRHIRIRIFSFGPSDPETAPEETKPVAVPVPTITPVSVPATVVAAPATVAVPVALPIGVPVPAPIGIPVSAPIGVPVLAPIGVPIGFQPAAPAASAPVVVAPAVTPVFVH